MPIVDNNSPLFLFIHKKELTLQHEDENKHTTISPPSPVICL